MRKTSIKQARKESFDFLGYKFGPHCFEKNGRWYMGASPSKKSVARIKQKVGDLLVPNNVEAWSEVRDRLNQTLRGWCAYFSYGTTAQRIGRSELIKVGCRYSLYCSLRVPKRDSGPTCDCRYNMRIVIQNGIASDREPPPEFLAGAARPNRPDR